MRIWTPACREKQYFLTLYFRETGSPNYLRIGRETVSFGSGREAAGRLARAQIEVTDGEGSIELFPGAKILGVVVNEEAGFDLRYQSTLNPKFDEIELIRPSDIVVMPGDLAKEVAIGNEGFTRQLEVIRGKRKRFVG